MKFSSTSYGMAMLTWNLPQIVDWSKAKEYLLTSCKIDSEALRSGLLNRIVDKASLLSETIGVATAIASYPGTGPQNIKRLMREGMAESQRSRFDMELLTTLNQLRGQRNQVGELFAHIIDKKKV